MTNFIKTVIFNNNAIISIVENNQYTFHVDPKLKKPEIKKFCQEILNTPVISVNTLNLPPKKRHLKMKRAYVKFEGTKDTTNPFKNFLKVNYLSSLSLEKREKEIINEKNKNFLKIFISSLFLVNQKKELIKNKNKIQENLEFKIFPLDLETLN